MALSDDLTLALALEAVLQQPSQPPPTTPGDEELLTLIRQYFPALSVTKQNVALAAFKKAGILRVKKPETVIKSWDNTIKIFIGGGTI